MMIITGRVTRCWWKTAIFPTGAGLYFGTNRQSRKTGLLARFPETSAFINVLFGQLFRKMTTRSVQLPSSGSKLPLRIPSGHISAPN